jgi:hypothetical protein
LHRPQNQEALKHRATDIRRQAHELAIQRQTLLTGSGSDDEAALTARLAGLEATVAALTPRIEQARAAEHDASEAGRAGRNGLNGRHGFKPKPRRDPRPPEENAAMRQQARDCQNNRRRRLPAPVLLPAVAAALALAACTGLTRNPSGAMSVTVKPGDTGTCAIAPCQVYFEMPPGKGDYRVRGTAFDYGTYPAGKTVNLGGFYEPIVIGVIGMDVPKAYVYIPIYR